MNKNGLFFLLIFFFLSGCASVPEKVRMLEAREKDLSTRLATAESRIAVLERTNAELTELLQRQRDITKTLDREKSVHMSEVGDLRQNTREFLGSQIAFLREFSQKTALMDYVGGELISRQYLEGKDLTLVDLKNTIPAGGSLFGTWGHFAASCTFVVNVLRKVDEKWFVIWQSEPLTVVNTEKQKFDFRVPVSVEKGDAIAYTFRGVVGVKYDRGTGETVYVTDDLKTGDSVKRSDFKGGTDQRSYSIGVMGVFG